MIKNIVSQTTDNQFWTIVGCHQSILLGEDESFLPTCSHLALCFLTIFQSVTSFPSLAHCQDTQGPGWSQWMLFLPPKNVNEHQVSDWDGQGCCRKEPRGEYSSQAPQPHHRNLPSKQAKSPLCWLNASSLQMAIKARLVPPMNQCLLHPWFWAHSCTV